MTLSLHPAYNLKAVLKETGVKPDVLRAWERRYGVPMPERTTGGHRLYSERDIAIIKWLLSRQNEGLSISHAVQMWKEEISRGADPLADVHIKPALAPSGSTTLPTLYSPSVSFSTSIDALRSHWLEACMQFNEAAADQALNQAFALHPVETVCMQVLQRGLVEIGGMWYENRASIQQEHFASALAMRRLDALLAAAAQPTRSQTVMVGCPAEEWHSFTPLIISLFIRRRGFNVIYLGPNVPVNYFVETVRAVNANLVVLAAQQLNTAASLQELAALLSAQGMPVAFGGRIFAVHHDLAERIAGHYLGDRLDSAIDAVELLIANRPMIKAPLTPSIEYVQALQVFVSGRALVEAKMNEESYANGLNPAYFSSAHKYMGDNIVAALRLGNMNYLNGEIEWLNVMLEGYNLPRSLVPQYLDLYSRMVRSQLASQALPITSWFERSLHLRNE